MEVIATVNYEKLEQIGSSAGQNSRVFRAFDHHLNAELVVKEVEKTLIGDASRYFTEARALHASAHPRVVPVRWAGQTADLVCIAMPRMPGGSLADAIRTKPLRPSEVIRLGQDLCEGVAQVHIAKLVHLDVKPTNVLFDAHERATLTDFGLAIQVDADGTADVRDHALYPSFLPPEVVVRSRGIVTAAADVYQIGLTLYRAVNGEPFFSEQWERIRDPYPAGRDAINEGRFPDRTFLPGIPIALRQVIARALSIDPALRQVGARQLAEDLGKVDVKHDWEVEEYTSSSTRWRLRQEGRADVLVLRQGSLPSASVEIWTDGEVGRRRKSPRDWSTGVRTRAQLTRALNRAFRVAPT